VKISGPKFWNYRVAQSLGHGNNVTCVQVSKNMRVWRQNVNRHSLED